MRKMPAALVALALALPIAGCTAMKYEVYELFGKEKRDLLRSALGSLVDEQKEAKQTFGTALERVKRISGFEGGDLETEYDRLKGANDDAKSSARAIDARIEEIETTSRDLFAEWQDELSRMRTPSLRTDSERKLRDTRSRFDTMHRSMTASRATMDPALQLLEDHVLYLKHNLNAAAIGSLDRSMGEVESSIRKLQESIEDSIREAQGFLTTME